MGRDLSLAIVLAIPFTLGCGGPAGGPSETWTGTLTGTTLGPFICLSGTDGYFDEAATVTLTVPSPGLIAMVYHPSVAPGPYTFSGTFINTETAHENTGGAGCEAQPSVQDSTTPSTAITVNTVQPQLQVTATTVLIPGHFLYSQPDSLDATKIFINPGANQGDTTLSGGWTAQASSSSSAVSCSGIFSFTKQ